MTVAALTGLVVGFLLGVMLSRLPSHRSTITKIEIMRPDDTNLFFVIVNRTKMLRAMFPEPYSFFSNEDPRGIEELRGQL